MMYIKVLWIHEEDTDPVWLYSEIDEKMYEVRKVEVYADDSFGFAGAGMEFGGTMLGEVPVPDIEEIAQDPAFIPTAIMQEEFERVWEQYTNFLNNG
ncbi:DUF6881 domain-containing protein [Chitinophaga nivalis]|uniref:DUF6881 domain-containing protein n=1 Tax=Chitinophaga nivalis TaxID=2991709 RepID=A0ABT3IRL4_9BACT|nr:hypothetical protein [Chitinophaga nivalis]MCW3463688.1 hypothetical protein [Chitinophaga nivalis]MCW3486622.1 hypothetical protein [Chitinophaga nivalis]